MFLFRVSSFFFIRPTRRRLVFYSLVFDLSNQQGKERQKPSGIPQYHLLWSGQDRPHLRPRNNTESNSRCYYFFIVVVDFFFFSPDGFSLFLSDRCCVYIRMRIACPTSDIEGERKCCHLLIDLSLFFPRDDTIRIYIFTSSSSYTSVFFSSRLDEEFSSAFFLSNVSYWVMTKMFFPSCYRRVIYQRDGPSIIDSSVFSRQPF